MDATGVGVGFLIALVVVASLALHLTYPRKCRTCFQIFSGECFELPAAMAGKRCMRGEMVSNTSGTGDPVCQESTGIQPRQGRDPGLWLNLRGDCGPW